MKRHSKEAGFAMLLVFLMAAMVAIMLYTELPRVAFEAERQHELLLVDRGNQFKRAIQVFVTDRVNNPTHRYPASLDELESFNNHRYLRHRYADPMTGKEEWRLVHINGGVLTDSVTTQMNSKTQSTSNTPATPDYISAQAYMDSGSNGPGGVGGAQRAMNRRPSDSQQPGGPGGNGMPGGGGDVNLTTAGGSSGMQGNANGAGAPNLSAVPGAAGIPGMPGQNGIPGQPGMPPNQGGPPGSQPQQPVCDSYIGGCPTTNTSQNMPPSQQIPAGFPGLQGQQGQQGVPMNGGAGVGGPPGFPGGQQNGQANPQSAAANMIQNLLTTPRPGGMPTNMPGSTIGGGIAGVASKYEAEGIMVINDRTAINEWEYIFDMTKYRVPPNPISGAVGTPQQPMGAGGPGGASPMGPGGTPQGPGMGAGGGRGQ